MLVVGGERVSHEMSKDSFAARQTLIRALGWAAGAFRVETLEQPLPRGATSHDLGDVAALVNAARERARSWPALASRLPGTFAELRATLVGAERALPDVRQQRVVSSLEGPMTLPDLAHRTLLDDHVLVSTLLELADQGAIRLDSGSEPAAPGDPTLLPLVSELLAALTGRDGTTLKLTVLSWDARTCFRTVEALLGRFRRPPEDVESQPRYHILHETSPLPQGLQLEVLAFRADAFEPVFAAPLVQNCHIFLFVTDLEAGHVWGSEQPLADRLNELRTMFQGALVAGRVTIGAGAVTDPGSDVIIPEIGRYTTWAEVNTGRFLHSILHEVGRRLGLDLDGDPDPALTARV